MGLELSEDLVDLPLDEVGYNLRFRVRNAGSLYHLIYLPQINVFDCEPGVLKCPWYCLRRRRRKVNRTARI